MILKWLGISFLELIFLSSCWGITSNWKRAKENESNKTAQQSAEIKNFFERVVYCKNEYEVDSLINSLTIFRKPYIERFGGEDYWLKHIQWLKENGGGAKITRFIDGQTPEFEARNKFSPYQPEGRKVK